MTLNDRQSRFVVEYLKEPNAARACERAGYSSTCAWRLINRPDVREAIEQEQRRLLRPADKSVERIIAAYARVAFASIDDVLDIGADGSVSVNLPKAKGHPALHEVIVDDRVRYTSGRMRVRQVRITLASKLRALDALARHLGIFKAARGRAPAVGRRDKPDLSPQTEPL